MPPLSAQSSTLYDGFHNHTAAIFVHTALNSPSAYSLASPRLVLDASTAAIRVARARHQVSLAMAVRVEAAYRLSATADTARQRPHDSVRCITRSSLHGSLCDPTPLSVVFHVAYSSPRPFDLRASS